ncbi:fibrillin-1 isoform X2 [Drosophila biarmipes]|uniref:fibrillin-1 isoform X2 n=1 Tax=Drosophila biarmipes TaxID=125945 RepID=UPI001CDB0FBB|nr:fibrillin-1 isoform X2 [Drosophila biarmipes]
MLPLNMVLCALTCISYSTAYNSIDDNIAEWLDETCYDIDPPEIRNGNALVTIEWSDRNSYMAATYSCIDNYELNLKGDRTLFCMNGLWLGNIPECVLADDDSEFKDCETYEGCSHFCNGETGKCQCYKGYTLNSTDFKSCEDIDECKESNGGCSHKCHNMRGEYICTCNDGYEIDEEDGHTCVDIDECADPELSADCQAGCDNLVGSYKCRPTMVGRVELNDINGFPSDEVLCKSGFQLSPDGSECQDINECELVDKDSKTGRESPRYCGHKCENTVGSYICHCPEGYHLLEDRQSCALNGRNRPAIIIPKAIECPSGFEPSADGSKCQDIDECKLMKSSNPKHHPCQQMCENSEGSFRCHCSKGYHLLKDDRSCASDPCPPGFERSSDGLKCQDINECELANRICHHGCTNTNGSYICHCKEGYHLRKDKQNCDRNIICQPGYTPSADGTRCQDIDECKLMKSSNPKHHPCQQMCGNAEGSFRCHCSRGYHLLKDNRSCALDPCPPGFERSSDGLKCQDINECELVNRICHHGCTNTNGSYICHCKEGYHLRKDKQNCDRNIICQPGYTPSADGTRCQDIDECKLMKSSNPKHHPCQQMCENAEGSFRCHCWRGYHLLKDNRSCALDPCSPGLKRSANGINCQQIDYATSWKICTPMQHPPNGRAICRELKTLHGFNSYVCDFICDVGYALIGSSSRSCGRSGIWNGSDSVCVGIQMLPSSYYKQVIRPIFNSPQNTERSTQSYSSYSYDAELQGPKPRRMASMRHTSTSYDRVGIPLS